MKLKQPPHSKVFQLLSAVFRPCELWLKCIRGCFQNPQVFELHSHGQNQYLGTRQGVPLGHHTKLFWLTMDRGHDYL